MITLLNSYITSTKSANITYSTLLPNIINSNITAIRYIVSCYFFQKFIFENAQQLLKFL